MGAWLQGPGTQRGGGGRGQLCRRAAEALPKVVAQCSGSLQDHAARHPAPLPCQTTAVVAAMVAEEPTEAVVAVSSLGVGGGTR